jgi:hypothetical protein
MQQSLRTEASAALRSAMAIATPSRRIAAIKRQISLASSGAKSFSLVRVVGAATFP